MSEPDVREPLKPDYRPDCFTGCGGKLSPAQPLEITEENGVKFVKFTCSKCDASINQQERRDEDYGSDQI